jgi:hypothetical protein
MATISELFKQGHNKLRREPWNKHAHVEVSRMKAGVLGNAEDSMGPWVTMRDIHYEGDPPVFEKKFLVTQVPDDDSWEPWVEVPWPWET